MKNTFCLFAFCIFFVACSSENKHEKNSSSNDNNGLAIKPSRGENILETLYQELKEQRPELLALEQEIEAVDQAKEEALADYRAYNAKNEQGYTMANQQLSGIKDSLLRNSIELLIQKSQYAYDQDNAAMALAAATLENRSTSLHDHQEALKIILTLNLLEKYQEKQIPNSSAYEKIITRYNSAIHKADSLLQAK